MWIGETKMSSGRIIKYLLRAERWRLGKMTEGWTYLVNNRKELTKWTEHQTGGIGEFWFWTLDSRQCGSSLHGCWEAPGSARHMWHNKEFAWSLSCVPGMELLAAAAAAKLLQLYLTLCDPIDGSPIPGIFQARTLEWVAIAFSNAWKWKVKVKSLSRVRPSAIPWTAAYQAPPTMRFSRQEYWSRLPSPSSWSSLKPLETPETQESLLC